MGQAGYCCVSLPHFPPISPGTGFSGPDNSTITPAESLSNSSRAGWSTWRLLPCCENGKGGWTAADGHRPTAISDTGSFFPGQHS